MDRNEQEHRAQICAEEYGGIIPYVEAFYIHSIIYSASRCLDSFKRYDDLKSQGGIAAELINIVQEAVGHAAALSRYFWPSPLGKKSNLKNLKECRGTKLKEAFQLDEESVLNNRDLRNAWEHFDERLDSYFLENDAGYFFPGCMLDNHSLVDDPDRHIFKLLDTESECLALLGSKYFFAPIRGAVQEVLEIALKAEANGSRLPSIGISKQ